jgi:hypothetical protein
VSVAFIEQALVTVVETVTLSVIPTAWAVSGLPTKNARNSADEVSTSFAVLFIMGRSPSLGGGFSVEIRS